MFVVAFDKLTALIALTEFGLDIKTFDGDRLGRDGLQEDVGGRCVLYLLGFYVEITIGKLDDRLVIRHSLQGAVVEFKVGQYGLDECRTAALGIATTQDKEVFGSSRESYVEQIEVVDGVLEVFVQVVRFVNGTHHLLCAIVDGDDGQGVER